MTYTPCANLTNTEWLRLRQTGIGGSDVPALVMPPDKWKWARPADVLASKLGPIEELNALPCRIGHYMEPLVAKLFEEQTGLPVRNYNLMMRSDSHPFMIANIDRKLIGRKTGLEIKTGNPFGLKEQFDTDTQDYPYHYYFQIQHYLGVSGWDDWYLACLRGNNFFRVYHVERDDDTIRYLTEKEQEFWTLKEKGITVEEMRKLWQ